MRLRNLFLLCIACAAYLSEAQDIHWSQPSAILIYQNPAFTGIGSKYSMGLNFRDQWNPVNKSYKTFAASGDYRFGEETNKASVGAGAVLYRDISADGSYIVNSIGLTLSGLVNINERSKIGGGIGYNFIQNSMNKTQYTWGNQFNGQSFDAGRSTGEEQSSINRKFSDLSAGVSYAFHEKNGTVGDNSPDFLIIGYSINHINRPEMGISGSTDKLAMKHTVMITGVGSLDNSFALKPTLLIYTQGKMLEIIAGTLIRTSIGQVSRYTGIKKGSSFSAGLLYRFKDALIPTMEFEKSNFAIGLSYDVTLSKLSKTSKYQGGLEIHLRLKAPDSPSQQNKKTPEDTRPMY